MPYKPSDNPSPRAQSILAAFIRLRSVPAVAREFNLARGTVRNVVEAYASGFLYPKFYTPLKQQQQRTPNLIKLVHRAIVR